MTDRVGQHLGHYHLLRLLGQGSFAEVYLGEHVHLGTEAAIKLLHAPLTQTSQVEAFRQEARRLAQLQHPHIVRVLEFGFEGEQPYLVLEYASGGSLRQRHTSGTQVPLAIVVTYVEQVAEALQYAHDQRVIHRDLKPQNLLLGRRGEVLLADFGISVIAASTSQHSSTQAFAGTVAYAAPEQIQGHPRPASDQYALGIVVYEWLTGQLPFSGSLPEVIWKQMQAAPPALRGLLPSLRAEVEQVVLTALAKDPKDRFASVRAFATALQLSSETQRATAEHPSGISTDAPSTVHFIPAPTLATPQAPSTEHFTPPPTVATPPSSSAQLAAGAAASPSAPPSLAPASQEPTVPGLLPPSPLVSPVPTNQRSASSPSTPVPPSVPSLEEQTVHPPSSLLYTAMSPQSMKPIGFWLTAITVSRTGTGCLVLGMFGVVGLGGGFVGGGSAGWQGGSLFGLGGGLFLGLLVVLLVADRFRGKKISMPVTDTQAFISDITAHLAGQKYERVMAETAYMLYVPQDRLLGDTMKKSIPPYEKIFVQIQDNSATIVGPLQTINGLKSAISTRQL